MDVGKWLAGCVYLGSKYGNHGGHCLRCVSGPRDWTEFLKEERQMASNIF